MNIDKFYDQRSAARDQNREWRITIGDVIEAHKEGCSDFSGAEIVGAFLPERTVNFDRVSFYGSTFSGVNLTGSFLETNFGSAKFLSCGFTGTLNGAKFRNASGESSGFNDCSMIGVDMSGARFVNCEFSHTDLTNADLGSASLTTCKFTSANLTDTYLANADLFGADLSQAIGLSSAYDLLRGMFEFDDKGLICYKQIGMYNAPPKTWEIRAGAILREHVCTDRTIECGCGVNAATLDWVKNNYDDSGHEGIWKCRIPYDRLMGVVVPYSTNGKIRTDYLELIELA